MELILQKAIIYWKIIKAFDIWDDLEQRNLVPDGLRDKALVELIAWYSLDESYEKLCGKAYRKELTATFGQNMENSPLPVCKAMVSAKAKAKVKPAYRNFAEILVLNQSELSSSYALQHWLRSRNTLEFLSIWEQRNNMTFKKEQADLFIRAAHKTNTTITLKKWVIQTGAIGIVAIPGRYGGTYADPIIANDFEAWLSPEHRYQILTLFMKRESVVERGQ